MQRATVLKTKLAEANHAFQVATNDRASSLQKVSQDPTDEKAHAALDAAIVAVPKWQSTVEALESALQESERLDQIDEIQSKRGAWIAARERAVELSGARVKQAKSLQAAIEALAVSLKDFEAANDSVLMAIYEATAGAEPKGVSEENNYHTRASVAPNAVTSGLRQSLVLALKDAGVGEVGFDLTGSLEFHNPSFLAHGNRQSFVEAVKESTRTIDSTLTRLHRMLGIIEPDASTVVEDAAPPIAPPQQTWIKVKDPHTGEMVDELYTSDVTEVVWGAKQ